ncbi:hypothetical protein COU74_04220 [Candidatus Peregrinibacteria bacterium CG10_big_fil_rev_8_21_14_0_10_36_19]|nr:MAG: hypothetical protein COU74_04220 [Candidatus Peregrinibacteria bacterium CG10_big_fil_rev_8_21_14_0_10_36_19]
MFKKIFKQSEKENRLIYQNPEEGANLAKSQKAEETIDKDHDKAREEVEKKATEERAELAKKVSESIKDPNKYAISSLERSIGNDIKLRKKDEKTYILTRDNQDLPYEVEFSKLKTGFYLRKVENGTVIFQEKIQTGQIKKSQIYNEIKDTILKIEKAKEEEKRKAAGFDIEEKSEKTPVTADAIEPISPQETAQTTKTEKPSEPKLNEKAQAEFDKAKKTITDKLGKGVTIENQIRELSNSEHTTFYITRDGENIPFAIQFNRRNYEKIRIIKLTKEEGKLKIKKGTSEMSAQLSDKSEIFKEVKKYVEQTGSVKATAEELEIRALDIAKRKELLAKMPNIILEMAHKVDQNFGYSDPIKIEEDANFQKIQIFHAGTFTGITVEIDKKNPTDVTFTSLRSDRPLFARFQVEKINTDSITKYEENVSNHFKLIFDSLYPGAENEPSSNGLNTLSEMLLTKADEKEKTPAKEDAAYEYHSIDAESGSPERRKLNIESLYKLKQKHLQEFITKFENFANAQSKTNNDNRKITISKDTYNGTSRQTISIDGKVSPYFLDIYTTYDAAESKFETKFNISKKEEASELYDAENGQNENYLKEQFSKVLDSVIDERPVENETETISELESKGIIINGTPENLTRQNVKDLKNAYKKLDEAIKEKTNVVDIEKELQNTKYTLENIHRTNESLNNISLTFGELKLNWTPETGFGPKEETRETLNKIKKAQLQNEEQKKTFDALSTTAERTQKRLELKEDKKLGYVINFSEKTKEEFTLHQSITTLNEGVIRNEWKNIENHKRVEMLLTNEPFLLNEKEIGLVISKLIKNKKTLSFSDILKNLNFKNFDHDILPRDIEKDPKKFLDFYKSLSYENRLQAKQLTVLTEIIEASLNLLEALGELKFTNHPEFIKQREASLNPEVTRENIAIVRGLAKLTETSELSESETDKSGNWERFKTWLTGEQEDINNLTMADMNGNTATFDRGNFRRYYSPAAAVKIITNTKGLYEDLSRPKKLDSQKVTKEVNRLITLGALNKFIAEQGESKIFDVINEINESEHSLQRQEYNLETYKEDLKYIKQDSALTKELYRDKEAQIKNTERQIEELETKISKLKSRAEMLFKKIAEKENISLFDVIKNPSLLNKLRAKYYRPKQSTTEILASKEFKEYLEKHKITDIRDLNSLTQEQIMAFQAGFIIDQKSQFDQKIEEGKKLEAKHPAFKDLIIKLKESGLSNEEIEKIQTTSLGMAGVEFRDGKFNGAMLGKKFDLGNGKSFALGLGANGEGTIYGVGFRVEIYEGEKVTNSILTEISLSGITPNAGIGMQQTIAISDSVDLHIFEGVRWSWDSVIPTLGGGLAFSWNKERALKTALEDEKNASIYSEAWKKFTTIDKHDTQSRYNAIMAIPQARATFQTLQAAYGLSNAHVVNMVEQNEKDINEKVEKNLNEPWYKNITSIGISMIGPVPIPTIGIRIGTAHLVIPNRVAMAQTLERISDVSIKAKLEVAMEKAIKESEADVQKFTKTALDTQEESGDIIAGKNGELMILTASSSVNLEEHFTKLHEREIQEIEQRNGLYRPNKALQEAGTEIQLLKGTDRRMELLIYNSEDKDVEIHIDPTLKNLSVVVEGGHIYLDGNARDLIITRERFKLPFKGSRSMSSMRDMIVIRQRDSLRGDRDRTWITENEGTFAQKLEDEAGFTIQNGNSSELGQDNLYYAGSEIEKTRTPELEKLRHKEVKAVMGREFIESYSVDQAARIEAIKNKLIDGKTYDKMEVRQELKDRVRELYKKIEQVKPADRIKDELSRALEANIGHPKLLATFISQRVEIQDLNEKELNYGINLLRNLYFTTIFPQKSQERIRAAKEKVNKVKEKLNPKITHTESFGQFSIVITKEHNKETTYKILDTKDNNQNIFENGKLDTTGYTEEQVNTINEALNRLKEIREILETKEFTIYVDGKEEKLSAQSTQMPTLKAMGKLENMSYYITNNNEIFIVDHAEKKTFQLDSNTKEVEEKYKAILELAKSRTTLPALNHADPETPPTKSQKRRLERQLKQAETNLTKVKQSINNTLIRTINGMEVAGKKSDKGRASFMIDAFAQAFGSHRLATRLALKIYTPLTKSLEDPNYDFSKEEIATEGPGKIPEGAILMSGSRLYTAETKEGKNYTRYSKEIEKLKQLNKDSQFKIEGSEASLVQVMEQEEALKKQINEPKASIQKIEQQISTADSKEKATLLKQLKTLKRIASIKERALARVQRKIDALEKTIAKERDKITSRETQILEITKNKLFESPVTVTRKREPVMSETVSYQTTEKEDGLAHEFGFLKNTVHEYTTNDENLENRELRRAMLEAASPIERGNKPAELIRFLKSKLVLKLLATGNENNYNSGAIIALETEEQRKLVTEVFKDSSLLINSKPHQEAVKAFREIVLKIREAEHNGTVLNLPVETPRGKIILTITPTSKVVAGAFSKCANASWYVTESVIIQAHSEADAANINTDQVVAATEESNEVIENQTQRKDIEIGGAVAFTSSPKAAAKPDRAPRRKTGETTRQSGKPSSTNSHGGENIPSQSSANQSPRPSTPKSGIKGASKENTNGKA